MLLYEQGDNHKGFTVLDLVGLSPLLVDEDDGDQDDDLNHDAQEGPDGGQPAADTQLDAVAGGAQLADTGAHVLSLVQLYVQGHDGQGSLVGGALDLVLFFGVVGDGLKDAKNITRLKNMTRKPVCMSVIKSPTRMFTARLVWRDRV